MSFFNRGIDGVTVTREVTFSSDSEVQLKKVAEIIQALDPEIHCEVYADSSLSSISFTVYETLDGQKEF